MRLKVCQVFGTSYTLYDRQTVERLLREQPEILPQLNPQSEMAQKIADGKVIAWEKKQVTSQLLQGILQGESNVEIARRMRNITNADWKSVMRYARTATTGANAAAGLTATNEQKTWELNLNNSGWLLLI
jgi:hypothetical protein